MKERFLIQQYAYHENKIGQGKENAKLFLANNPDILLEIENQVRECYGIEIKEKKGKDKKGKEKKEKALNEESNEENKQYFQGR